MFDSNQQTRHGPSPSSDQESGPPRSLPDLSPDCDHFLQVAAVVGSTFVPGEVATLLQRPVAALLPVIDEALRNRVLRQNDETLSFRDRATRQEILGRIPAPVLGQLRTEATRAGVPAPDRNRNIARFCCLTETERVIARLVGAGMTNQQVATRVRLSPHTVNYHLQRIFRKLDIRSRVELARILPERS